MKIMAIVLVLFLGAATVQAQTVPTGFLFGEIQGSVSDSMRLKVDLGSLFISREVSDATDGKSDQKYFLAENLYVGPEMKVASAVMENGEDHWWPYENRDTRIMLLSVAGQKVGLDLSENVCLESIIRFNDGGSCTVQVAVRF